MLNSDKNPERSVATDDDPSINSGQQYSWDQKKTLIN